MKIVIIGAGIAGLIAESYFKGDLNNDIWVFDPKSSGLFSNHKAVMRLRDKRILNYLPCKLEEITVYKAICKDGVLYNESNIMLNNLYSIKMSNSLSERSLSSLGKVKRYLITKVFDIDKRNHQKLEVAKFSVEDFGGKMYNTINLSDGPPSIAYDICISTIPMPSLLKILDLSNSYDVEFKYSAISINTYDLNIKSDVNQTIYFTKDHNLYDYPYRATIENNKLIIESKLSKAYDDKGEWQLGIFNDVIKSFGLRINDVDTESVENSIQPIGKISPIDDDIRKKIMMDLTDKFNIYSFGRFATWRQLRIDQILDDIEKIGLLVRIKNKKYYDI